MRLTDWILKISLRYPWSLSYGVARSLFAFSLLCTLLFNDSFNLFKLGSGVNELPLCESGISIYCLLSNLNLAKWISIVILGIVASGWRPRITGIFHWWVTYSFANSATILEGGDHIAAIITLLLVPCTLTDNRRWHWVKPINIDSSLYRRIQSLIAQYGFLIIKIQVSIIYLNAAVAKANVKEWADGTAMYYWLNHPTFGSPSWLDFIFKPIITYRLSISLFTWGVILFEFILFAGLFMKNEYKRPLLILGIIFHFGIFVIHGLTSFSLVMSGALVLFLSEENEIASKTKINYNRINEQ